MFLFEFKKRSHGYGRSQKGIVRRQKADPNKKLDKWIKQCLDVNEQIEERKLKETINV